MMDSAGSAILTWCEVKKIARQRLAILIVRICTE